MRNRTSISISFPSSAANLSQCQTSMDFAIAQWTLHPFEQFHLLLQLKFASSPKCSITACTHTSVCVWVRLCVWAAMSDASMILTLEHYNNHVVRKTLPLFVHVSYHSAVDVRLGVCVCAENYLVKAKIDDVGCVGSMLRLEPSIVSTISLTRNSEVSTKLTRFRRGFTDERMCVKRILGARDCGAGVYIYWDWLKLTWLQLCALQNENRIRPDRRKRN